MFTHEALLAAAEAVPQGGMLPRRFSGVMVESRGVRSGQLFLALDGDVAARRRAVAAAVDAGATAILATTYDAYAAAHGVAQLVVADPLGVLRRLARDCRRRQPHTEVIAVTGGADAPAAKDAVAALLAHRAPTLRMPDPVAGGRPGELEVLLALVGLAPEHGYAVLELDGLGRDITGMTALCRLATPRVGVILPIQPAAPGPAGGDAHARAADQSIRGAVELLRALPAEGLAVLDADGRHARHLVRQPTAQLVTYGRKIEADVRALRVADDPARGTRFTLVAEGRQVRVQVGLPGERAVTVALAAAAVALRRGLALEAVAGALSELRALKPRRAASHEPIRSGVNAGMPHPSAVAAPFGLHEPNAPARHTAV